MGLDIHGVLGEAVAEPRKKEQERATWALFRLTTVIPSSSFQEMHPGCLPPGRFLCRDVYYYLEFPHLKTAGNRASETARM